jgi:hypothetical protein
MVVARRAFVRGSVVAYGIYGLSADLNGRKGTLERTSVN